MIRKYIVYLIAGYLLLSIIIRFGYFLSDKYYEGIKINPKKHAYHPKIKDTIYLLTDIEYYREYIRFYQNIEKGNFNIPMNFPMKAISLDNEIYILNFHEDSLLVHVACYYKSLNVTKFIKAYAYKGILHDFPFENVKEVDIPL